MRTITGVLLLPDSSPVNGGTLEFTATLNSNQVLLGTKASTAVSGAGAYSIDLRDCRYSVRFTNTSGETFYLGAITVTTGDPVGLDELLLSSSLLVPADLTAYIDTKLVNGLATKQDAGSYLESGYDSIDEPTTPTGLSVSLTEDINASAAEAFTINITWNASSTPGNPGVTPDYRVVYYYDEAAPMEVSVSDTRYTIQNAKLGETYVIKVWAVAKINRNIVSPSYIATTIDVTASGVASLDTSTVSVTPGLDMLMLRWSPPASVSKPKTHIYCGTDSVFIPDESNRIYSGYAPTYLYSVQDTANRFFKFIIEDQRGELSDISDVVGPFAITKINSGNITAFIEEQAVTAFQIADGSITNDKIIANEIAVDRLAILDLSNLVANNNFSVYDSNTDTYSQWSAVSSSWLTTGAGSMTLGGNTKVKNLYQFPCSEGDKFYASAKLTWANNIGTASKGLKLIFLDSSGSIIAPEEFIAVDATDAPQTDLCISGFKTAPANAVKAYIQLVTESITDNVEFQNIICRSGAAVLIDDGEITAEKITVNSILSNNILAQNATITGELEIGTNGLLKIGSDPGVSSTGILLSNATGIQAYKDDEQSGYELTFDVDPSTGAAWFKGTIEASEIKSASSLTGSLELSGITPKLYTSGKTDFKDTTPGIFLGYTTVDNLDAYALDIGGGLNYIRWDGTNLKISGNIEAGNIDGSIIVGSTGAIYSDGKDHPGNFTPGFYLGHYGGVFQFSLGGTARLHFDGEDLHYTGRVYGSEFIVTNNGKGIRSYYKSSYSDTDAGFFLGWDSTEAAYTLNVGNGTKYLKWNGTDLEITGTIRGGKTTFIDNSNAGFYMGPNASGIYQFSIGDDLAGKYVKWDGFNLQIAGDIILANLSGAVVLNSEGSIYTSGKSSYGNSTAGFFLGYSSGYKFDIGNSSKYLRWDGSNLSIKGNILANKTNYSDNTDGYFLGDDSGYKFYIGNANEYFKWTGSAISARMNSRLAYGTGGGSGLVVADYTGGGFTKIRRLIRIDTGYTPPESITSAYSPGYAVHIEVTGVNGSTTLIPQIHAQGTVMFDGTNPLKIAISFEYIGTPSGTSDIYVSSYTWVLRRVI